MPKFEIINSLAGIEKAVWNSCFIGELEDYDYLMAVEKAEINGFVLRYLTAWDSIKLIAAVPFFLTNYKLDTTLQGAGKKISNGLNKAFPKLLLQKLACFGSPCSETVLVGFDSEAKDKPALLTAMLDYFEDYAVGEGYKLLGIKDIPENSAAEFGQAFKAKNYNSMPALPAAWLDVNFATIDDYINKLSKKMRKDLRRKMKNFAAIRVGKLYNIDDILPQVLKLYLATRERSIWQFEELTEAYFKNVLSEMPGRSFCMAYYVGDELLAVNLLIHNEKTLLDKFFCMSDKGRDYDLYFLSWLTNIQTCIEQNYKRYESGQNYGDVKTRLNSQLSPNVMFFKHSNLLLQGMLKLVSPLFSANDENKFERSVA